MFSTSVWNLSDFLKGVERASIYLMIFLAVAMLAMPLVQTQEAEAQEDLIIGIVGIVIGVVALGYTVLTNKCGGCGQHNADHSTTCPAYHSFYTCKLDERWHHGRCTPSDRN